ncbi:hypothetical protein B6V01_004415 [Methanosarcinales archaeon ex4572_44]|nr:MAG: hypothetical protein B6V01_004415 [Methanosarcinales archaeon ex4572_44]RLG27284.1 MAG: hypothetical protein DRN85_00820 [Methanosarcinales archaeon]
MDQNHLRVSQLATYNSCPRKIYFEQTLPKPTQPGKETLILKELSHLLPSTIKKTDEISENDITRAFHEVCKELAHIYPGTFAQIPKEELVGLVKQLDTKAIADGLSTHIKEDRRGFLASITPHASEPLLYSEKHRLAGVPNKIVKIEDEFVPSVLKTGRPPENGVWKTERLLLTGYALLVEEHYNTIVKTGIAEYLRHGTIRKIRIRARERREVLQTLHKIKKIHQNQIIPEKPPHAPCERCEHKEQCEITPETLSSKFF